MRPPIRPRAPGMPLTAPEPPPPVAPAVSLAPEPASDAPLSTWQESAQQTLSAAKARLAVLQPEVAALERIIAALS